MTNWRQRVAFKKRLKKRGLRFFCIGCRKYDKPKYKSQDKRCYYCTLPTRCRIDCQKYDVHEWIFGKEFDDKTILVCKWCERERKTEARRLCSISGIKDGSVIECVESNSGFTKKDDRYTLDKFFQNVGNSYWTVKEDKSLILPSSQCAWKLIQL